METGLFGLSTPSREPRRNHSGEFAPRCDGKPQAQVKKHLEMGLTITVQQCFNRFHTTELRRIISRLRKSGMNIGGHWYGKREYFIYKLIKETPKN